MKKMKLKLAERFSLMFASLFIILMLFCGIFIIYFLKVQNDKNSEILFNNKIVEINEFLDKIDSFSKKYDSIALEFNPKVENQIVTYSKPFDPGEKNYKYIIRIRNKQGLDDIPLNTVSNKNSDINFDEINRHISLDKINKSDTNKVSIDSTPYYVVRMNRNIGGNMFDIYILQDISFDIILYKRLILLIILYTIISIAIILLISKRVTKKMLKPINNIIDTANSISTSDLTARIQSTGTNDELDNLIKIINNMLNRLNIAFDNQSKFISDVSHELRTPLAIIKGYSDLIIRHGKNKPEIIYESVALMSNEANNMKDLIDKLLFLAKGDAKNIKTNFATFDSSEFINQINNDAKFISKEHNITIERNEKYTIFADKSLLNQAIRILIENSYKYSEPNTNIYINSYFDNNNDCAVISIRDEGMGIEKEYLDKIFERFYRIDESRAKETGGTGLGLSILKKIITIHNGKVDVKSEVGVGSIFTIYIPSKGEK